MPDFHLVVTQPFADYGRGDVIRDPDEVERLNETHHDKVVRIAAPVEPPATAEGER